MQSLQAIDSYKATSSNILLGNINSKINVTSLHLQAKVKLVYVAGLSSHISRLYRVGRGNFDKPWFYKAGTG